MSLAKISESPQLPVTLAQVKDARRVLGDEDDRRLDVVLNSAVDFVQERTGWQLRPCTYVLSLPDFPRIGIRARHRGAGRSFLFDGYIRLPNGPVTSVDRIDYLDSSGQVVNWPTDVWQFESLEREWRIGTVWNTPMPSVLPVDNAVQVTYRAGFTADTITGTLRSLVLAMCDLFDQGMDIDMTAARSTSAGMPALLISLFEMASLGDEFEPYTTGPVRGHLGKREGITTGDLLAQDEILGLVNERGDNLVGSR